jgi:dTDP-4-amino-4,6-dideoxygalactose transaminase
MKVQFLDVLSGYHEHEKEFKEAAFRVLESGCYISGPEVENFELNFSKFTGAYHAVGVANGLDAIYITLLALNIGPGDEVIIPSNTFIATWLAVSRCGAIPVPVEPKITTMNIDPTKVAGAITSKTKAIIAVHLYGQPADLNHLISIAKQNNLKLIEDAAQAHGASYFDKKIGSHSDFVAWSFYPGKNLGAFGDAGAITTNNKELAEKVRKISNYGSEVKYVNDVLGVNSRLDPIQAAFLNIKLASIETWNAHRAKVAEYYNTYLKDCGLELPFVDDNRKSAWHLYVIRHPKRDQIVYEMSKLGIQILIHYPIPPHLQNAYANLGYKLGDFPIAESLANEVMSLPLGPHIKSEEVRYVVRSLRVVLKELI